MKFKTLKTTETGKKFTALFEKSKIAKQDAKDFSNKYGFSKYRGGYWCCFGGISSCLDFKETPDKKIWGKGAEKGEFMPKGNSKIGKSIQKEIDDLTVVTGEELNECIGVEKEPFHTIGFTFNNDEYYGFIVGENWDFKIPEDCEEITVSEYNKLFK
tara:strand:+ start:109 stop:579 length:471 start_codon:yes stop_codon:yes gene_type:complete